MQKWGCSESHSRDEQAPIFRHLFNSQYTPSNPVNLLPLNPLSYTLHPEEALSEDPGPSYMSPELPASTSLSSHPPVPHIPHSHPLISFCLPWPPEHPLSLLQWHRPPHIPSHYLFPGSNSAKHLLNSDWCLEEHMCKKLKTSASTSSQPNQRKFFWPELSPLQWNLPRYAVHSTSSTQLKYSKTLRALFQLSGSIQYFTFARACRMVVNWWCIKHKFLSRIIRSPGPNRRENSWNHSNPFQTLIQLSS